MADVVKDIELVKKTRDIAKEMIDTGTIYSEEYKELRVEVQRRFTQGIDHTTFN
jgi:ATP-dependent DNA helicase RecG